MSKGSGVSTAGPTLAIHFFDYSHSSGYEMVPRCDLDFISFISFRMRLVTKKTKWLKHKDAENIFTCFSVICVLSLGNVYWEMSTKILCRFLYWIVSLFHSWVARVLYIFLYCFLIRHMVQFANILSHSVGSFTLSWWRLCRKQRSY